MATCLALPGTIGQGKAGCVSIYICIMVFENDARERLHITALDKKNSQAVFDARSTDMTFIWNTGPSMDITVDKVHYRLQKDQLIFLTAFHKLDSITLTTARMVRFNQPFYCIVNHDNEVGSKGFLFFGASAIPVIQLETDSIQEFEQSWQMISAEMSQADILKKDMLQLLLKRMLILSARILRKATRHHRLDKSQHDIIREFNYLVEMHFAEHHDVAFYADKLNKSPKTLSNLFSEVSERPPLHIIHERIMIHARRQINYTSRSIKEIAYELGYEDLQTFSRFFKNREGISPVHYRERAVQTATNTIA